MAKQSGYLQRREAELDATFNAGAAMAMQFAMDTLQMALHQHNSVIYRLGKIKTETGLDARKFWDLVKLLEMEES